MPFYNKCVKRGISCLAAGYSPFLISFLVSISCLLLTTLHNPVYFCLQMVQEWYKNHPKTRIYRLLLIQRLHRRNCQNVSFEKSVLLCKSPYFNSFARSGYYIFLFNSVKISVRLVQNWYKPEYIIYPLNEVTSPTYFIIPSKKNCAFCICSSTSSFDIT